MPQRGPSGGSQERGSLIERLGATIPAGVIGRGYANFIPPKKTVSGKA